MGAFDKTKNMAKPVKHDETDSRAKAEYEHPDITDNRMVWEVLEDE